VRWTAFAAVGALGFAVQLAAVVLLTMAGWQAMAATAVAVELAVLHNFAWHERWTWVDRAGGGHGGTMRRLLRFHLANGVTSIAGNVAIVGLLVAPAGLHPVVANGIAVVCVSAANFLALDRWVFRRGRPLRRADRLDFDACRLEAAANPRGKIVGSGRVAVDADRFGLEGDDAAV
jgi:putative flippase GtrA